MDFHPETAYVALQYFDRYLSRVRVVQRRQFHLLALTALFVAAKMEEEILEPVCSDMIKFAEMHVTVPDLKVHHRFF